MGKATVQSAGAGGLYSVKLKFSDGRLVTRLAKLSADIADLQATKIPATATDIATKKTAVDDALAELDNAINTAPPGEPLSESAMAKLVEAINKAQLELDDARASLARLRAELAAKQTEKTQIEKLREPGDPVDAWCADYTTDLSGDVGTIEVNGEHKQPVIIRPGYNSGATYSATRDGQLQQPIASGGSAVFFNQSLLPAWQKHKPTYRVGTLVAKAGDVGTVDLDSATSSQQAIAINKQATLTNIPIQYMTCNGAAFSVNDRVVVEFPGQNWDSPRIIGFESNPKPCAGWFEFFDGLVWDLGETDDPTLWPTECKSATTPYNPYSTAIPAGSAFDNIYMSMNNDPHSAFISANGRKIYFNRNQASISDGAYRSRRCKNEAAVANMLVLIPGDAKNLVDTNGDKFNDAPILTTWKRFELDFEYIADLPGSCGGGAPWNNFFDAGFEVFLIWDFADDPSFNGSFDGICANPLAASIWNAYKIAVMGADPTLYANLPSPWPVSYRGITPAIWNVAEGYCYKPGSFYQTWPAGSSAPTTFSRVLTFDRTTQTHLALPNDIKAICITDRSSYHSQLNIKSVKITY